MFASPQLSNMENCRDSTVTAAVNGATGLARPTLDRKAMDALVNAMEARLREQGAQFDRRLAELEAGLMMEMSSLGQGALDQAQKEWNEQTLALWQQRKEDLNTLRQEFTDFQRQVSSEIVSAVEREVTARVDAMAQASGKEIAELRQRLIESERTVLEITLGMGEWFRELAARMCTPRAAAQSTSAEDRRRQQAEESPSSGT